MAEKEPPFFNSRIGTQTFAPLYGFTEENALVETARGIYAMGSDILKMSMSPSLYGMDSKLDSLSYVETAKSIPAYSTVFSMPFQYYLLWVHDKGTADALNMCMDESAEQAVYREMYALTCHLLTTYNKTGKVFLLGHWEGDWVLLRGYDTQKEPDDALVQGMIRSLTLRQKAVEDARRETPHSDIYVGHYCEVNRPLDAKDFGKKRMVSHVLPNINIDMVSYSAYDSLKQHRLAETLDYIEQNAKFTSYFNDIFPKKVFVGEYDGYFDYIKNGSLPPEQQAQNALEVITAAVAWGAPFVLYWEFYSNGTDGMPPEDGFWLIDRNNQKQPVYYLHQSLLAKLNLYHALCRFWLYRAPYQQEIDKMICGLNEKSMSKLVLDFFMTNPFLKECSDDQFQSVMQSAFHGINLNVEKKTRAEVICDAVIRYSKTESDVLLGIPAPPTMGSIAEWLTFLDSEVFAERILQSRHSLIAR